MGKGHRDHRPFPRRCLTGMPSAYERSGLSRNPFIADGPELGVSIERGIELPAADFVQVAGERGVGKTTLMKQWQQLHGGTYHYVEQGRDRWRPVPIQSPIVYWDEADRLPRVVVRRALAAAHLRSIRVVVGTHRNLAGPALSAGMTTAVVRLDQLDADQLTMWVQQKIAAVAADPVRAEFVLGSPPIEEILAESGASWRVAGDLLHSWVASRVDDGDLPGHG